MLRGLEMEAVKKTGGGAAGGGGVKEPDIVARSDENEEDGDWYED